MCGEKPHAYQRTHEEHKRPISSFDVERRDVGHDRGFSPFARTQVFPRSRICCRYLWEFRSLLTPNDHIDVVSIIRKVPALFIDATPPKLSLGLLPFFVLGACCLQCQADAPECDELGLLPPQREMLLDVCELNEHI
jgi:hypothetical protein